MKPLLLAVCVWGAACGGSETGSPGPSAHVSLEETALQWGRAALGGKRVEALALSLTHAQFADLTTKEIEKADYDQELGSLLDGLAREGSENAAKVVTATVAERKTLPAGEKRKREMELAAVSLVVEGPDGQRHDGMPIFFVRTDAGWRFTPRK